MNVPMHGGRTFKLLAFVIVAISSFVGWTSSEGTWQTTHFKI
jgi:hypothetical protein